MPHILQPLDELRALIDQGAGENPTALRRARDIVAKLRSDCPDDTGYVKDKSGELVADLAIWFSASRWNRDGRTRESTLLDLEQDVVKLERALRIATKNYDVPS